MERLGLVGRAQSIFSHSMKYGYLLGMMLWVLFCFFLNRIFFNRKLTVVISIVFVCAILTTNSRSPLIFLLVSGFIYWFIQGVASKIRVLSILLVLIFVIFFAGVPISKTGHTKLALSIFQEIGGISSIAGSSLDMRKKQLVISTDLFLDKPLWGHGLAAIRSMMNNPRYAKLYGAESFMFQLLIETGITGIIGYFVFYIYIIRYFWENKKTSTDFLSRKLSEIMISVIFGYLAFIFTTGQLDTFNFFIIIITLSAKHIYLKSKENQVMVGNSS